MFTIFFGAAVYSRKRPANHQRLILLTILNFVPPAIGRLPIAFIAAAGPLAFFGIPELEVQKTGRLGQSGGRSITAPRPIGGCCT